VDGERFTVIGKTKAEAGDARVGAEKFSEREPGHCSRIGVSRL